jgi:DNA-binding response OmpR family regulator
MKGKILLVEGKRADRPSFFNGLSKKGFQVRSVTSGKKALDLLALETPDIILIDASSMRTSGIRICNGIKEISPMMPVVLVVDNEFQDDKKIQAEVILAEPFTLQKLLNRIRPLIPSPDNNLYTVGPIQLDVDHNWVRCGTHQSQLTPRLVMLLRALMGSEGYVINRTELFKTVWETEYIGDTRTLDVHISWLREAIEDNPRKPRYIKTVRGKGYKLDISGM